MFNEESITGLFNSKKVFLTDEPIAQHLDLIEQQLSSSKCPVEELV